MKILAITDGGNWCLDKLTQVVVDGNPQHTWKVLKVHPKNVAANLPEVEEAMEWADLVWHQYFRTGAQLFDLIPQSFQHAPQILTHHNQRDRVFEHDQSWVNHFACHTEKMKEKLQKHYPNTPVTIIRHGIDLDFFSYDDNPYSHSEFTVGYVGRTKPWKRLANIADVCKNIGVRLVGMGRRDDGYANSVDWDAIDDWKENIPDHERFDVYKEMSCFVQYSEDGIEEGTMPALEAMAAGVPLITSNVGTMRDIIKDGHNGLIVNDDKELSQAIRQLKESPEMCEALRSNAWETIKGFSEDAMAWNYQKLFNAVRWDTFASVVIPTFNRPEELREMVKALNDQDFDNLEVIIADDGPLPETIQVYYELREQYPSLALKYVRTDNFDYGLAQARNMGALQAVGQYLIFIDDRYKPAPDALRQLIFACKAKDKHWVFGDKGANKKDFVENYSCIRRQDFINMGMFSERITQYGGMSQECRKRAERQGFTFTYVPEAKAEVLTRTRRKSGRRSQIWKSKHLLKTMGL